MNRIDKIENLTVGDIITIGRCKDRLDRSFLGDLMTVTVVDPPFICVDIEQHEHYHKSESDWKNHSLRFDEYEFFHPSSEYVEAIKEAKRAYQEKKKD